MFYIEKFIEYYNELYPADEGLKNIVSESIVNLPKPAKIIEIEAGPNIFSRNLDSFGLDITATDTFGDFTSVANSDYSNKERNLHIFNISTIDIARYLGSDFFNIALCINSRILIVNSITLLKKFLFDVKMLLKDNGVFIIEVVNFSKYDLFADRIEIPERKSLRVSIESYITRDKDEYYLWETLINAKKNCMKIVKNRLIYPITKETLEKVACELKYSSVEFYSDYNKTPYSKDSERVVCILRK